MAGIIRREAALSAPAYSFADFESEADAIRAAAAAQAREILAQARRRAEHEAETLRAEARRAGYEEGRAKGQADALREAMETAQNESRAAQNHLTSALTHALNEYENDRHALRTAAERGMIRLALAIARRVCRLEVGADGAAVVANVSRLLELARHEHDLVLHLHPSDLETGQLAVAEWLAETQRREHVEVRADESAPRGTCRLSTRCGELDASVETQLDRIAELLLQDDSREAASS